MKAFIFTLLIAASYLLELIMVNMTKNIPERTSHITCISLLSLSLFFTSSNLIIWLFSYPTRFFVFLNIALKSISTTIFSILYYTQTSVPSLYVILSFLDYTASLLLFFLFKETPISPMPKEEPNIKITIFISEEPSSCTICLEPFSQQQEVNETVCKHIYHLQCMKTLLNNNIRNCPLCRTEL